MNCEPLKRAKLARKQDSQMDDYSCVSVKEQVS